MSCLEPGWQHRAGCRARPTLLPVWALLHPQPAAAMSSEGSAGSLHPPAPHGAMAAFATRQGTCCLLPPRERPTGPQTEECQGRCSSPSQCREEAPKRTWSWKLQLRIQPLPRAFLLSSQRGAWAPHPALVARQSERLGHSSGQQARSWGHFSAHPVSCIQSELSCLPGCLGMLPLGCSWEVAGKFSAAAGHIEKVRGKDSKGFVGWGP